MIIARESGSPFTFCRPLAARRILAYAHTMDRIDIYRSAALLIRQHGDDAVIEAAMKADAMLDKGDLDGQRVWKAIVKAIEELQRGERKDGEPIN